MKTRHLVIPALIVALFTIGAVAVIVTIERYPSPGEPEPAVSGEKAVEIAVAQFKDIEAVNSSARLETVNSSVYLRFPGTVDGAGKLVWIVTVEGKPKEWLQGGQVYIDAATGDVLLVSHVM
ncbi:MAG: Peptidase propeptide and YPEB domain protein [Methanocella sp. PtaU1.Bin125]|nr:MAG: Peptidase propeptide and YPEB domain protein [Methanocella sp. PtaU1.Bin125]